MSTYSIFTPPINAVKQESLMDAFNLLPNNTAQLIDPFDLRSALYTIYESSPLKYQTVSTSTFSYVGLNENFKDKIFFGNKKDYYGQDVMNNDLLISDTDLYFYNVSSNINGSTKIGFLAGAVPVTSDYPNIVAKQDYGLIGLHHGIPILDYDDPFTNLEINGASHSSSSISITASNVKINGLIYPRKESATNAGYALVVNGTKTGFTFAPAGSGTVNSGSASYLAYYKSNGTTLDDTKESIHSIMWDTTTGAMTIGATGSLSIGTSNTPKPYSIMTGMSNIASTYSYLNGGLNDVTNSLYSFVNGTTNTVNAKYFNVNGYSNYLYNSNEALIIGSTNSVSGNKLIVNGNNATIATASYVLTTGRFNTVKNISEVYSNGWLNNIDCTGITNSVSAFAQGTLNTIELPYSYVFGYANGVYNSISTSPQMSMLIGTENISYKSSNSLLVGNLITSLNTANSFSVGYDIQLQKSNASLSFGELVYVNADYSFVGGKGYYYEDVFMMDIYESRVSVEAYNSFNFSHNTAYSANYTLKATASVILGGWNHGITSNSYNSVILGGNTNLIQSKYSGIISSPSSQLSTLATYSVIMGGKSNTSNLQYSVMLGLDTKTADKEKTTYVDNFKHYGGVRRPVTNISSATSISETQYMIVCDTTGSGYTVTINTTANNDGQEFVIINKGSNNITLASAGGATMVTTTVLPNTKAIINYSATNTFWI